MIFFASEQKSCLKKEKVVLINIHGILHYLCFYVQYYRSMSIHVCMVSYGGAYVVRF